MMEVILTRGLSGSGKTTWAKEQVDKGQGNTVIVCKDDIRGMLWNSAYSSGREKMVKDVRNTLIQLALSEGKNVIVADTNFDNHEQVVRDIVSEWCKKNNKQVSVRVQDFTHVPLNVCIERDAKRPNSLGADVIKQQYNRWIKKEDDVQVKPLVQDTNLQNAVIFDVDGTLAHMNGRGPFEWMRVKEDLVDEVVAQMARDCYNLGYVVLIVSGRDGVCRDLTIEWLNENKIPFNKVFTRKPNDMRKDSIIKEEIFFEDIFGKWNVRYVVDDRNQVVETWRKIGLKCLQAAPGDF